MPGIQRQLTARAEWRPPPETPWPMAPPELPEPPAESPPGGPVEIPEPSPERREKPPPEVHARWPLGRRFPVPAGHYLLGATRAQKRDTTPARAPHWINSRRRACTRRASSLVYLPRTAERCKKGPERSVGAESGAQVRYVQLRVAFRRRAHYGEHNFTARWLMGPRTRRACSPSCAAASTGL